MNTTYQIISIIDESNNEEVCISGTGVPIIVNPVPDFSIDDQEVCADVTSVNLVNLEPSGFTGGNWSNASGNIVFANAVDPSTGPFTYSFIGSGNCIGTDEVNFTINILPTVSISGTLAICDAGTGSPETTTLDAGAGFSSYQWTASNGGSISGAITGQSIQVSTAGDYTVEVTDANSCTNTSTVSVSQTDCTTCDPILVDATTVCGSNGTYTIDIVSITGGFGSAASGFEVTIGGTSYAYPDATIWPLTGQTYSVGNQDVVTLMIADADDTSCTTTFNVFELNCVDQTSCNCDNDPNSLTITSQASGNANGYGMVYVLVDATGTVLQVNQSGTFGNLLGNNSVYTSYAINFDLLDIQIVTDLTGLIGISFDPFLNNDAPYSNYCFTSQNAPFSEDCICINCSATISTNDSEICLGEDSDIVITTTDGIGPYTIMIDSDGNASTAEITQMMYASGASITVSPTSNTSYTIISVVDEGNGNQACDVSGSVTINVNVAAAVMIADQTICADVTNVDLTGLEPMGQTGGTWSTTSGNIMDATNVDPSTGPFTYIFTDGNGCTDSDIVTFTINPLPIVSISGTLAICDAGTGTPESTTLDAGAGFTTYQWSATNGGSITGATTGQTIQVSTSGDYIVEVTDANGCKNTSTVSVTQTDCTTCEPILVDATTVCGSDGTYTIDILSITGGFGSDASGFLVTVGDTTYTYPDSIVWPLTGQVYSGGNQNAITLLISDFDDPGCDASYNVFELNCVDNVSCDCSANRVQNGTININAQASGNANGFSMIYVLTDMSGNIISSNQSGFFGGLNGDGTMYFVHAVNVDNLDLAALSALLIPMTNIQSLTDGTAPFNNFCYTSQDAKFFEDCACEVCNATITSSDMEICSGESSDIIINVADGTGPYTIMIDSDGDLNTAEISQMMYASGSSITVSPSSNTSYTIISVVDEGNGNIACDVVGSITINVNVAAAIDIADQTICADIISLNLTSLEPSGQMGGVWSNALDTVMDATNVDPNMGPFTYAFTDVNGCMATDMVAYIINALPTVSISGTLAICDAGTGTPESTILDAGAGFSTYQWSASNGGSISGGTTGQTIQVSTAGDYTVEVSDANGCTNTTTVTVSQTDCTTCEPIMVDASTSCASDGTYTIDIISITGGFGSDASGYQVTVGGTTYNYPDPMVWPLTGQVYSGGDQSIITLQISDLDDLNCATTYNVFELNCVEQTNCDCSNDPNSLSITTQASGNANGFSMVYVLVDPMGNIALVNQTGTFNGLLGDGSVYTSYAINFENTDIQIIADLNALIGNSLLNNLASLNQYCFTLRSIELSEDCGCTNCSATISSSDSEICIGDDGTLVIDVTDGIGPYTITIDTDGDLNTVEISQSMYVTGATITVSPSSNTTYTLISVVDVGNNNQLCDLAGSVTVNVNAAAAIDIADQTICSDITSVDLTSLEPIGQNGGTWSNTSGDISNPSNINPNSGPFTYLYIDSNNCPATDMVSYTINEIPTVNITGDLNICNPGTGAPETTTLDAGGGFTTYAWTTSGGAVSGIIDEQTLIVSAAGVYTVVVTDANGCSNSATVTVTQSDCSTCGDIEVSASTSCNLDGTYNINIANISGGFGTDDSGYVILIGPNSYAYPQDNVITGQAYSGGDQSVITILIIDNDDPNCRTNYNVFELNCADQTSCDCNNDPNSLSITTQASGNANGFSMLYVLVDNMGTVIAHNQSGTFTNLLGNNTQYTVYAINIDDNDIPNFTIDINSLTSINAGDPILTNSFPYDMYCYVVSETSLSEDCMCDMACAPFEITANTFCENGSYTIDIISITGGTNLSDIYEVEINGNIYDYPSEFPLTGQAYSGGDQSKVTLIITDPEDPSCTTTYEVFELNCADQEICDCATAPNSYTINSQASANANEFELVYALVDASGTLLTVNQSGSFPNLIGDGSLYTVFVFNVETDGFNIFLNELQNLTSIQIGDPILSDGTVTPFDQSCYTHEFATFSEDCGCAIDDCGADCGGDSFAFNHDIGVVVGSTGGGDPNGGGTQPSLCEVGLSSGDCLGDGVEIVSVVPQADTDCNGDGAIDGCDESVTIINSSSNPIDIGNWMISDNIGVRHVFPANTIIQPGEIISILTGALNMVSGCVGVWNNGGDGVFLVGLNDAIIDMEVYSNSSMGQEISFCTGTTLLPVSGDKIGANGKE